MQRLQFWRFDNEAVRTLLNLRAHVFRSALESSLIDLVFLRVSQLNACSYCAESLAQEAITHGLEQHLVSGVAAWREVTFFSERQRAALAWTDAVTEVAKTGVPDEVYCEAAHHFSDSELVNLTLAIALMNAFARLAVAFRHGPPPMPAMIAGPAATNS